MSWENIWGNYIMYGNELTVKNCSGPDMQLLIAFFNYLKFTKLHFANSDIKDSDMKNLKNIGTIDRLCLNNCHYITDQGLIELIQMIKPKNLIVSDCPNITDECLKE